MSDHLKERKKSLCKNKVMKLLKRKKKLETKLRRINRALSKQNSVLIPVAKSHTSQDNSTSLNCRVKNFVQVRDTCMKKLQKTISDKSIEFSLHLVKEDIEKMTLQHDQNAILACLRSSLYEDAIQSTLKEIKTSTKKGFICSPTIFKVENSETNKKPWNNAYNFDPSRDCDITSSPLPTAKVRPHIANCSEFNEKPISLVMPQTKVDDINQNMVDKETISDEVKFSLNSELNAFEELFGRDEDVMEMEPEKDVNSNLSDDHDIKELLDILEGTDDTTSEALRIKKMRDYFGYEDMGNVQDSVNNVQDSVNNVDNSDLTTTETLKDVWKNERYIYLHKIFGRCSQMPASQFFRIRKCLGNYFGEDSDFEHEDSFSDNETFLASCARRILPSVVKCLTPYYSTNRIRGGTYIFKNLVRRIADSLIDVNDYPSSCQIESYVKKYFPLGKTYSNVLDVWCFMVDNDL